MSSDRLCVPYVHAKGGQSNGHDIIYDSSETTLITHHDTNNNNIYDCSETINTHHKA
jgi:hypothetical protein